MEQLTVLFFLIIFHINFIASSNVYHENTFLKFIPTSGTSGDYFGYSIALNHDLYVGAPKAIKPTKYTFGNVKTPETTGSVYICSLKFLNMTQIKCDSLLTKNSLFKEVQNGGWFGASLALLQNTIMVTAPRQNPTRRYKGSLLQLQGACHFIKQNNFKHFKLLLPLADDYKTDHQIFTLDGKRPEYGVNGHVVYYYSLGQAGFSAAITKNDNLILGAPGLIQYTGGVIGYNLNITNSKQKIIPQPIPNTYYTPDITTDDYFGYSVESGIFERNGSVLYIGGAPRSDLGRGKVLIFTQPSTEKAPLDIRARLIGPQGGSYFGASLCTLDINADGLDDLLVGAPTFVESLDGMLYDQGAVFVYMTKESAYSFVLEESSYIVGSYKSAARFGSTIADIGDINGDGFRDVAIGAPFEDEGIGAVYIYFGTAIGLKSQYIQRIQPPGAQAFGWSISKGFDLDKNNCNDLAVGAFMSGSSYLYRCVPTMVLRAFIKSPSVVNLQNNASSFDAIFCVFTPPIKFYKDVQLNVTRIIKVDPDNNRAMIIDNTIYTSITILSDSEICLKKTIHVNVTANLLKPIVLSFELEVVELMNENSTSFLMNAARLSTESVLKTSTSIQLMKDCGHDLICKPWLVMSLKALNDPYVPGTKQTFGANLTISNQEEPAYGLKVIINLPMYPKRIPKQCYVQNLVMNCDTSQPFLHNQNVTWLLEMEFNANVTKNQLYKLTVELIDKFGRQNITDERVKEIILEVSPAAKFGVVGKAMPNASLTVFRENIPAGEGIPFIHYFEIKNYGPSDWPALNATIHIPEKTIFIDPLGVGCNSVGLEFNCLWSIKANTSLPIAVLLESNVNHQGHIFTGEKIYNFTTTLYTPVSQSREESIFRSFAVTTTIILKPPNLIWYIVGASILFGLILLAITTKLLHKNGFFIRKRYREPEQMDQLLAYKPETDDDASQSSNDNSKNERESTEENHNIILSVNKNTVSYRRDSIELNQ